MPGGHLELYESFEVCAAREVLEETGLELKDIRYLTTTNDIIEDVVSEGVDQDGRSREAVRVKKHYITVFVGGVRRDQDQEPEVSQGTTCLPFTAGVQRMRLWYGMILRGGDYVSHDQCICQP